MTYEVNTRYGVTTTFRSKIRRLLPTAREFFLLNLPKITKIFFFCKCGHTRRLSDGYFHNRRLTDGSLVKKRPFKQLKKYRARNRRLTDSALVKKNQIGRAGTIHFSLFSSFCMYAIFIRFRDKICIRSWDSSFLHRYHVPRSLNILSQSHEYVKS